jgi:hypothetical protein
MWHITPIVNAILVCGSGRAVVDEAANTSSTNDLRQVIDISSIRRMPAEVDSRSCLAMTCERRRDSSNEALPRVGAHCVKLLGDNPVQNDYSKYGDESGNPRSAKNGHLGSWGAHPYLYSGSSLELLTWRTTFWQGALTGVNGR